MRKLLSKINELRSYILAALLGLSIGLAAPVALDAAAEYHTYGRDHKLVFNEMTCLAIGMAALPEVAQAKIMGVSKRQYFAYIMKAAKGVDPSRVPYLEQYLFYLDTAWHAEDGGAGMIEQCFERAQKPSAKTPQI